MPFYSKNEKKRIVVRKVDDKEIKRNLIDLTIEELEE
jgi:hypothetical protein